MVFISGLNLRVYGTNLTQDDVLGIISMNLIILIIIPIQLYVNQSLVNIATEQEGEVFMLITQVDVAQRL